MTYHALLSTNIQDGGQLKISIQNILPNKADIKILYRLLYIVLESLSNKMHDKKICCNFPLSIKVSRAGCI